MSNLEFIAACDMERENAEGLVSKHDLDDQSIARYMITE